MDLGALILYKTSTDSTICMSDIESSSGRAKKEYQIENFNKFIGTLDPNSHFTTTKRKKRQQVWHGQRSKLSTASSYLKQRS